MATLEKGNTTLEYINSFPPMMVLLQLRDISKRHSAEI